MDYLLRVASEETSFLSPENDNTEELLARVKSIIPLEENKKCSLTNMAFNMPFHV